MRTMLSVSARRFLLVMGVMVAAGALAGCSNKGLSGIGTPCDGPRECPGGKVCAGGMCADPGNGRPGSPCSATRDCSGGNFCDGLTGVCTMAAGLDTGAACASDRQCRPPLRCSLDGFYGTCAEGGSVDQGGTCNATADCLSGLWCGANRQCAVLKNAYPPFAGVTCTDEGAFRAYFEVPRARQTAGRLLSPAVPERHPRQRRRARHLGLPQAWTDAAGRRPREAVCRHLDRRLRRLLRGGRHRLPLLRQHRLQQRHPRRRQDVRRDGRAQLRHRVRAQLGHQQRQHEVFVQPHAGRAQHARLPVRARPHLRGVRDDRPQVGHGRAGGRRRRLHRRHGRDAADGRRARTRVGHLPAAAQLDDEQGRRRARAGDGRGVHGAGRARAHGPARRPASRRSRRRC